MPHHILSLAVAGKSRYTNGYLLFIYFQKENFDAGLYSMPCLVQYSVNFKGYTPCKNE